MYYTSYPSFIRIYLGNSIILFSTSTTKPNNVKRTPYFVYVVVVSGGCAQLLGGVRYLRHSRATPEHRPGPTESSGTPWYNSCEYSPPFLDLFLGLLSQDLGSNG